MQDIYKFINKNTNPNDTYMQAYLNLASINSTNKFPYNILKENSNTNYSSIKQNLEHTNKKISGGAFASSIVVFTF